MKSWNSATEDITLKDGTVVREYDIRFQTTDRKIYKRIERFFQDIMDEADTPQTEPKGCCDCVHHTKEGCEYPSAYCSNWSEYKQKQTERVETMSCQEHCLWWFTDDGKDGYCQRHYHGKPCEFKPRTDCGWK